MITQRRDHVKRLPLRRQEDMESLSWSLKILDWVVEPVISTIISYSFTAFNYLQGSKENLRVQTNRVLLDEKQYPELTNAFLCKHDVWSPSPPPPPHLSDWPLLVAPAFVMQQIDPAAPFLFYLSESFQYTFLSLSPSGHCLMIVYNAYRSGSHGCSLVRSGYQTGADLRDIKSV